MTLDQLRDELDKWEHVRYRMKDGGVEYCFRHYSDFDEIEDKTFHRLRQILINSIDDLEKYVKQKITEAEDKIIEHPDNSWNN